MKTPSRKRRGKTSARIGVYLLSLPERLVRSGAALAGGLMRELGSVAIPAGVRRTKTYQTMVEIALRFMIQQVGEVKGVYPSEGELAANFLLRRTAGHGLELAGLIAFRASPVWILAALADISGAGRQIVQEIAEAMKQEGLLERDAKFENIDQILDGLERTAGWAADVVNVPPLDVAGLRKEWVGVSRERGADSSAESTLGAAHPRAMGRIEAGGGGAGPERFPIVVDHGGRRGLAHAGNVAAPGSGGQSSGVAHWPVVRRERTRSLQSDLARDRRARLRGLLGRGVSPVPACRRRAFLAQAPVADWPVVAVVVSRLAGSLSLSGFIRSLFTEGVREQRFDYCLAADIEASRPLV